MHQVEATASGTSTSASVSSATLQPGIEPGIFGYGPNMISLKTKGHAIRRALQQEILRSKTSAT